MGHSPAAVLSTFVRSPEHERERAARLSSAIAQWLPEADTSEEPHPSNSRFSSGMQMTMLHRRHALPKIECWVFIDRPDGSHENVCLDVERELLLGLLNDRHADVVNFCFGPPSGGVGFFGGSRYKEGSVVGSRSFVAIDLLMQALFPKVEQLSPVIVSLFDEFWDELVDDELVTLAYGQRREFMRGVSGLSHLRGLSEFTDRAWRKF